jgi:hypothetical protein
MDMKIRFFILSFCCIAAILVAGCITEKDMGTITPPTTVNGNGSATMKLLSPGGSYTFHVTSIGNKTDMIITITGTKKNSRGEIFSPYIVHNQSAVGGIDEIKKIDGFEPDTYTIEVLAANREAPWSIQIQ